MTYAAQNTAAPPQPIVAGPGTTVIQQNGASEPRPTIDQNQQSPPQNTYRKIPTDSAQPQIQPQPGTNDPYDVKKNDNATYFEAPKLFPKDRTAQRSIAPVRTALYEQPVSYHQISTARGTITAQQAQQDAIGWTSGSN